ncbi:hypothetical protein HK099_002211 [Clydaea vesicula]|uniref:Uncharacterized protein n=1 Tax=Clydaea vesicula TaxID=447962 RepID=A0AAD5XUQ1_9FUNG|nr:hypothetical protein HK099_002211 [Clydaea vesicula]
MVTFMLKLTDFPSAASIFYVAVLLLDLIQSRTTDKYLHLSKAAISLVLIWLDFYLRKHQTYFEPAPATDGYRHKSLEMKAGILSILTFNWLTPLISVGNKRILTEDDLWELNECDLSENSLARFQEVKKNSKTKNLYLLILYTIWKPFILQLIFGMVETALGLSGPFFLNKILKWIQCKEDTAFGGWGFLAAMFSCSIIKTLVDGQLQFSARRMGIQGKKKKTEVS